jgi:AraC-like DNA-binding protein
MTIQQIITSFGFLLSLVFLYYNSNRKPGAIFLGLFFLFLSAYSFAQCVLLYSGSVILVSLIFIHSAVLGFLIGPALFFFVRSVAQDKNVLIKRDVVHFIPAILFIIAAWHYYSVPWYDKMEFAGRIILNRGEIARINNQYISWFFPGYLNLVSRPLLVFLYALASLFLLMRHAKRESGQRIIRRSSLNLPWLLSLLGSTLLLAISQAFLVLISIEKISMTLYYSTNFLQIFSGIALFGILVTPFFHPSVLYGISPFDAPPAISGKMTPNPAFPEKNTDEDEPQEDKRFPKFDKSYLKYIEKATIDCMKNEKPYLSKDCNLSYFARMIDLPAHHLSFYFREVKGQAFNDFRNEWRVKHAKALIEDVQTREYTLEAIGLLSGFSSRNAFFVSFKKFEGMTPGAYAKLKNKN